MVVDDPGIIRTGIRHLLDSQPDMQVVGESAAIQEAVDSIKRLEAGIVIIDVAMSGIDAMQTITTIRQEAPEVKILILTLRHDEVFFFPAFQSGVSGYLFKNDNAEELYHAVRAVCKGEVFLSPKISTWIVRDIVFRNGNLADSYDILTNREKEVLKLAASGWTNREIAAKLFLSVRTVEKYRQGVMGKLGLNRREELARYALRKGLIGLAP